MSITETTGFFQFKMDIRKKKNKLIQIFIKDLNKPVSRLARIYFSYLLEILLQLI